MLNVLKEVEDFVNVMNQNNALILNFLVFPAKETWMIPCCDVLCSSVDWFGYNFRHHPYPRMNSVSEAQSQTSWHPGCRLSGAITHASGLVIQHSQLSVHSSNLFLDIYTLHFIKPLLDCCPEEATQRFSHDHFTSHTDFRIEIY